MSPREEPSSEPWDASQVVAYRLLRARVMRGKTQAWAAERLSEFTDTKWTAASLSLAESGSRSRKRLRLFTANELVAFARTYNLPVYYFFIPPPDVEAGPSLPAGRGAGWGYFLRLVFGDRENLRDARAAVADADIELPDEVPYADRFDGLPSDTRVASPDGMFASMLHGLAAAPSRGGGLLNADPHAFHLLSVYLSDLQNLPPEKWLPGSGLLDEERTDEHD